MSSTPADIRTAAMRWLVRREYSVFELRRRLIKKGFVSDTVDQVVAALVEEDWVCDRRFADALIHSRMQRGYGPLKILAQLRERGIDSALIDEKLDFQDPRWIENGHAAWQRRFPDAAQDYSEWAKQARFLTQRGFTQEQTQSIVGAFTDP